MKPEEYKNIYDFENKYWWYKTLDSLVQDSINKYFNNKKIKILDAGCGTGRMLEKLSSFGETEGFDASIEAVKYCTMRKQTKVSIVNLNSWKPESECYDLIISLDVLYHKTILNVESVIQSFNKGLNKNGILILNLPAFDILKRGHDSVVGGARRFRKNKLKEILNNSGFSIQLLSYRMPLLFLAIFLRKFFIKRKQEGVSDLGSINPFMNQVLYKFHLVENSLINLGVNMPFGSSLFTIAKKV